jgi:hypothetical protein
MKSSGCFGSDKKPIGAGQLRRWARPAHLPRHGSAPIEVSVVAKIASTESGPPPQLRGIAIAINRNGHITPKPCPVCNLRDI